MKKLLTLLSVLAVAFSLSMPVSARGASQEAPAQQTAPKKHVKKHHKKAKTAKKQEKEKKSKEEAPPAQ